MGLIVYISGTRIRLRIGPAMSTPKSVSGTTLTITAPYTVFTDRRTASGPRTHKLRDYHASADGEPHKERRAGK